ncbi:phytanoyl-CoA dioxygenase family protein [Kiloniella sp. b19]|uniref:phytanoyl-CoA dioxygenase family protein n=1 Tax=Kiloniella sp. GXU_MW_B19 TaxID=3141326 RepID=UPI0031D26668
MSLPFTTEQIKSVDFWRDFAPELTCSAQRLSVRELALSEEDLDAVSEGLWDEGYLALPPLYDESELAPVRVVMERLYQAGLPQVFVYLYDEVWTLFLRAQPLLSRFLGERYRVLPHFWAWYIAPGKGRGWPPHRDSADQSVVDIAGLEMLVSLTLWLPLTEATPHNGCMSVLPLDRERAAGGPFPDASQLPHQSVVALPAGPGALMGWRQDLWHWGGASGPRAKAPRLSLSLEFQNGALDPLCEPLFDPARPPAPQERLNLILKQFAKYGHIESIPEELVQLGKEKA